MSTEPWKNALVAAGYISLLVTGIFNSPKLISDNDLGVMLPIIMLSTLVASVALMGYLFFYQPALLIMDNKPKEAAKLLFSTIAYFVSITILVVLAWFLLSHAL